MSLEDEMMEVVSGTELRLVDAISEGPPLDEGISRTVRAQSQAICEGLRFLARRIEDLEALLGSRSTASGHSVNLPLGGDQAPPPRGANAPGPPPVG
jgi:hypothetical protein